MRRHRKSESGEVMLEGMIVMIITMLMLVWILGVGFLYYQKYTVRIATNDAAKKVAATYDAPDSDIIMGYVSANDMSKKSLGDSDALERLNEERAKTYVKYIMDQANLYGTVENVDLTLTHDMDALGRSHVIVTTECTFDTPFGEALELFGMSGTRTYTVTSYADSTSLTKYYSTVMVLDAFTNGSIVKGPDIVNSTIDLVTSFAKMYDQLSK